jgi:hypothetical protein
MNASERVRRDDKAQGRVVFPGTDVAVPVPDDQDGEDTAVAAAFDDLVRAGKLKGRDARGAAIPADAVYRDLGIAPRPRGRRPSSPNGRLLVRVPKSIHVELVERASTEGVSVNQLVLSYLSRALGVDTGVAQTR